jgi:hypothetical protein
MNEIGFLLNFTNRDKTIISYQIYFKYKNYNEYMLSINQNFYLNNRIALKFDYSINHIDKKYNNIWWI